MTTIMMVLIFSQPINIDWDSNMTYLYGRYVDPIDTMMDYLKDDDKLIRRFCNDKIIQDCEEMS